MKQSVSILFVTGVCAITAMLLAWVWGGNQEDVGCAIGGVVGFVLANGVAMMSRRGGNGGESQNGAASDFASSELGFAYGVFAVAYFAFVGWLTGYVHDHGDFAGTVCGGLGGFILAILVPAFHRSSFMAVGRKRQLALAVVAASALLAIVWAMYKHEFL